MKKLQFDLTLKSVFTLYKAHPGQGERSDNVHAKLSGRISKDKDNNNVILVAVAETYD